MTLRKAAEMALEALETLDCGDTYKTHNAASALRQALAQPEQEPIGWADRFEFDKEGHDFWCNRQKPASGGVPLYTAPPKREWVGLTDEEVDALLGKLSLGAVDEDVRTIEAKLKEKNT
jgi:hypothetical protein